MNTPVLIIGLGLIGGSLATSLSDQGWTVTAFDGDVTTRASATVEGIPAHETLQDALHWAQGNEALIVIAVPAGAIEELLGLIAQTAPECTITDVASMKSAVWEWASELGIQDHYVGSHPMAGSHLSGWQARQGDLFRNAQWVVTYDYLLEDHSEQQVSAWLERFRQVMELAHAVGSVVVPATSSSHDEAVAQISHIPHLLAEALTAQPLSDLALDLSAGSFRDTTRVAGTRPELARAMCEHNAYFVSEGLGYIIEQLQDVQSRLMDGKDIEDFVTKGYMGRQSYEEFKGKQQDSLSMNLNAPLGMLREQLERAESEALAIQIEP